MRHVCSFFLSWHVWWVTRYIWVETCFEWKKIQFFFYFPESTYGSIWRCVGMKNFNASDLADSITYWLPSKFVHFTFVNWYKGFVCYSSLCFIRSYSRKFFLVYIHFLIFFSRYISFKKLQNLCWYPSTRNSELNWNVFLGVQKKSP